MIEINLLPEELKKKKRSASKIDVMNIDLQKILFVRIAIVAAVIFVAIQVLVFGLGFLGSIIFNSMEKGYNKMLPQKQEADKLQAQISKMSRKVSAIDELMVKRFSWTKKLNDLSDSTTPGVWITQLEYDEKLVERPRASGNNTSKGKDGAEGRQAMEKVVERYLIISGAASSMGEEGTALIGRFIKNLKENPSFYSDFSDIELGSIKREQVSGQEVMSFKITCLFKIR
ncbi:MAG: hypothetical protein Q8R38_07250 [Candidatus Omnitrophota bacterium]|nr:hypothetical protein [Candidatus Omnitrophota bacterium]